MYANQYFLLQLIRKKNQIKSKLIKLMFASPAIKINVYLSAVSYYFKILTIQFSSKSLGGGVAVNCSGSHQEI